VDSGGPMSLRTIIPSGSRIRPRDAEDGSRRSWSSTIDWRAALARFVLQP
jgi:hypothetical protein